MLIHQTKFTVRAWADWTTGSGDCGDVETKETPSLLRRRITALGKNALTAAWRLPDLDKARYVFASRHGEFSRTLSILQSIAKSEALSPADFSLSVHHALISLLSITQKNCGGHIAVSSGEESFCYGLLEALSCLAENPHEPVVLVYCDEPLPGAYDAFNRSENGAIAIALLLGTNEGERFSVQAEACDEREAKRSDIALDFLGFMKGNKSMVDSYGKGRRWHWERYAVD